MKPLLIQEIKTSSKETYRNSSKSNDQDFLELADESAEDEIQEKCDKLFIDQKAVINGLKITKGTIQKGKVYESFEMHGVFGKYRPSLIPKYNYSVDVSAEATCSY